MRIDDTVALIERRLAGFVHPSCEGDPTERAKHERFIITRTFAGAVTLACLPIYLVLRGVPSPIEYAALVCLVMPVLAAFVLSRTGLLWLSHAISSASLAGFVVCLAAATGGVASPVAVWLVAVPLESLLSGSRRAAVAGTAVAAAAALGLVAVDFAGLAPSLDLWPEALAMPVFAITAIGHGAALAMEHSRREVGRAALMRAREASDRSLLAAIDDLVTWHDRNGHVLKASPAAAKLLGVAPGALQGRGLLGRVHVSDRPAFLKAISDAACSAAPAAVQFRLHVGAPGGEDDDRRVIWAETRAHRIDLPGDGNPEGYAVVAVTRDVTAHKRHAEEIEQARAEAERADASKGRFLATVSHELRTPLNAIIGFSEILAGDGALAGTDDRRKEYAQIIHESGMHLLEVVNTLLGMSRIESGAFDFDPEPVQIVPLVHGCCDLLQLKADQAGVLLARDLPRESPEVVADGRACRQILINLVSNAVKFTPRGGRVTVSVRRDGDRVRLGVADTGIGIAEADLPRLGDPFFQAGPAYARTHEGTGLGLSVVRGLVGLHGGEMVVESAPGEGTAVTVTLPLDCRTGRAPGGAIRIKAVPRRPALIGALKTG